MTEWRFTRDAGGEDVCDCVGDDIAVGDSVYINEAEDDSYAGCVTGIIQPTSDGDDMAADAISVGAERGRDVFKMVYGGPVGGRELTYSDSCIMEIVADAAVGAYKSAMLAETLRSPLN